MFVIFLVAGTKHLANCKLKKGLLWVADLRVLSVGSDKARERSGSRKGPGHIVSTLSKQREVEAAVLDLKGPAEREQRACLHLLAGLETAFQTHSEV